MNEREALISLLKEARKIIKAHQTASLTHKGWLQRSADTLKKMTELRRWLVTANAIGHDSRILHELAGAASLCWRPKPNGVFDTELNLTFVKEALKELRESAAQPATSELLAEEFERGRRYGIRQSYDAQPPREPLSDKQIDRLSESAADEISAGSSDEWEHLFARAVERAVLEAQDKP
jgi:hypothetical protein